MKRTPALVDLEGRALHVHSELGRPLRRRVRGGTPPNPITQAFRVRLDAQEAGRIGKHRLRVRPREALPAQHLEEDLGMAPRHVGISLPLLRRVAEIAPAIDHLLRRAAADAQLQAPAADEVGRAGVLRHVERVLVTHVDDRRSDLDPLGLCADRSEQGKRRAELAGEVMNAKVGAIRAELFSRYSQVDRLQQRIGRRSCL
jgi:hypothetical protein